MKWLALIALAACSHEHRAAIDDAAGPDAAALPAAIAPGDFPGPLDKAFIRSLQSWIDDPTFEVKWTGMLASPIDFLGGADSAFHGDLASRATPLPGDLVLCHGDAKLDNFGWTLADGSGVFSDNDFDDAGGCPAAADALHFLVTTDLFFTSGSFDAAALAAYVDTLRDPGAAIAIDPATQPAWDDVRTQGVDKATSNDKLKLGGEVQAASPDEASALDALVAGDARFPTTIVDLARDVQTTGGSAGLRRFWLLVEDAQHPRTILELKELAKPGTEFGTPFQAYDGPDRFDTLKMYWWDRPVPDDHFEVSVLGGTFVVRDRFKRQNPKPSDLSVSQALDMITAEASLLATKHRAAWQGTDRDQLQAWLRDSAATLTQRWRAAYDASR